MQCVTVTRGSGNKVSQMSFTFGDDPVNCNLASATSGHNFSNTTFHFRSPISLFDALAAMAIPIAYHLHGFFQHPARPGRGRSVPWERGLPAGYLHKWPEHSVADHNLSFHTGTPEGVNCFRCMLWGRIDLGKL